MSNTDPFQKDEWDYTPDLNTAEGELMAIVGSQEGFLNELVTLHARNPEIDISELAGLIQDWFGDNLSDKFHHNLKLSGSNRYGSKLPSFAELAARRGAKLPFNVGNC